jgi:hypothetical protein
VARRIWNSLVLTAALGACGGQTESVSQDHHDDSLDPLDSGASASVPDTEEPVTSDDVQPGLAPSDDDVPLDPTGEGLPLPEPDTSNATVVPEPVPEPPVTGEPEPAATTEPIAMTEPAAMTEPIATAPSESSEVQDAGGESEPSVEPDGEVLASLQRYWSVGGYVGQIGNEEMFWHFLAQPEFEYVHMSDLIPTGLSVTVSPGTYSLQGRTLSFEYHYRRYRFDVAVGTLSEAPALMTRVYAPLSETSWRAEFEEELLLEDGSAWRRDTVSSDLVFDVPIPLAGSGDCNVQAEYWVEHYELMSATGMELPEAERTTQETAVSDWIACHYGPSELGQQIELEAAFFDAGTAVVSSVLAQAYRTTLWIDPEQPDVLFTYWHQGRDTLPARPFGP